MNIQQKIFNEIQKNKIISLNSLEIKLNNKRSIIESQLKLMIDEKLIEKCYICKCPNCTRIIQVVLDQKDIKAEQQKCKKCGLDDFKEGELIFFKNYQIITK
jgi:hypothetical protein